MGKHRLIAHPSALPNAVQAVEVDIHMTDGDDMLLTYQVYGDVPALPEWTSPKRADELWKKTCFEIFIRPEGGQAYFEFNFSPSTEWAAYAFDRRREGMRNLPLAVEPHIERTARENGSAFSIETDLDLSEIPKVALTIGLSAVIEEQDGTKSYWALAHPPGAPDFHDPACFVLELPAPPSP